jgi:cytochrome c oxidase subunit II
MMWRAWIPFWRPGASAWAGDVDLLFVGLLTVSSAVALLLFILLLTFATRYRASSTVDRTGHEEKSWVWEVGWTTATLLGFLLLFAWGAALYVELNAGEENALPIYVLAKQWMWKSQHPGGLREINELHLPAGQPVRLTLASQDAIHSFFVPALRIKRDVVPGRYETLWFRPDQVGEFGLFCAEFCGTDHSRMRGRIVVLKPADYATWLANQAASNTLAAEGGRLFQQLGCSGCHSPSSTVRAPPLEKLYGKPVPLQDGRIVVADERYLRDAILQPRREIAAGYQAIMPPYAGRISEDELMKLVAYIRALAEGER